MQFLQLANIIPLEELQQMIFLIIGRFILVMILEPLQVIGNGSFGVVYQARLIDSQEMVAIKKVLQDKRFKVRL